MRETDRCSFKIGNLPLNDPAIGWINMIQALRVGIYHDALHFSEIQSRLDPTAP